MLLKYTHNIFHYITYRKNKIQNMQFNDVLKIPINLPKNIHLKKILVENDNDKYLNYKNNAHHWTTKYCWDYFIPQLMKLQLKILKM